MRSVITTRLIRQAALLLCGLMLPLLADAQGSELTITSKEYGDWQVRCELARGQPRSCVMMHQFFAQQSGTRLLQANVAKTEDGTLMTVVLPLGIYLPPGAVLQVDNFTPVSMPISFCTEHGCFVNEILDEELLELLRKKIAAKLTIYLAADEPVEVPFSITGFLDAYRSM